MLRIFLINPDNLLCLPYNAGFYVTRSQYGMSLIEAEGKAESFEAVQKEVYDVSGAGDTALAALAAGWCWGYGLKEAVRLSNVAAGIVVGLKDHHFIHTIHCFQQIGSVLHRIDGPEIPFQAFYRCVRIHTDNHPL